MPTYSKSILLGITGVALSLDSAPSLAQEVSTLAPATLVAPALDFKSSPEIARTFDKYFYFHREATGYAQALADVRECDALAKGVRTYRTGNDAFISSMQAYYVQQYGAAGAVGGAIGNAMASALADALLAAEKRKKHRTSLRNCMGFKGYQRYGLSEDRWKAFNFEAGKAPDSRSEIDNALAMQALVASGPKPSAKELGL